MRRAITILLALVLALSLAACGGGNSKAYSKDQVEAALKSADEDVSLQQSGDDYVYASDSITNTSDYLVKVDSKGNAQYVEIRFQNIDTSLISGADSITKVIDLVTNRPGDSRLIDVRAGVCILHMMNLVTLFDDSYSNKSSAELINAVAAAFANEGSQFGGWKLSSTMNSAEKTVMITAEPVK